MVRQPDRRIVENAERIKKIPAEESQQKTEGCTGNGNNGTKGSLPQPVKMPRQAGAGKRSAYTKNRRRQRQDPADRANMRVRRQAAGLRNRHPRDGDDLIKHHARKKCDENCENAIRAPVVDEIPEIAEEAEPPALHHDAESDTGQQ